jgi:hypothetical protein
MQREAAVSSTSPPHHWPSVTVVIPAVGSPTALADRIESVLLQQYPGSIECLVVGASRQRPLIPVARDSTLPPRHLRCVWDARGAGEGGACNVGGLGASGDLLTFCTPRGEWSLSKLRHQVLGLPRPIGSHAGLCGVQAAQGGGRLWIPPLGPLAVGDLLGAPRAALDPSLALLPTSRFVDVGFFDEAIPWPHAMHLDWLLRLVLLAPTYGLPAPLVWEVIASDEDACVGPAGLS